MIKHLHKPISPKYLVIAGIIILIASRVFKADTPFYDVLGFSLDLLGFICLGIGLVGFTKPKE